MYRGEIQNDSIGGSLHRSLAFSPSNSGGGGNDRFERRNLSVGAGIGRCEEDEYNCCGLYGRGENEQMEDDPCWEGYEMIGTKMKKGREVPNCVPVKGEGFWDDVRKGLVKHNERKKSKPISEEEWKKQMEDFKAPTEAWGADELGYGGDAGDKPEGATEVPNMENFIRLFSFGNKDTAAKLDKAIYGGGKPFTKEQLTQIILDKNKVIADLEENAYGGADVPYSVEGAKQVLRSMGYSEQDIAEIMPQLGGAEAKPTSGVAAAAEALKPVRTAIQNKVGDLIYGAETDPRKQKKGLLGISEEGKEESKKKVMKNIVVPVVRFFNDTWDSVFDPDKLQKRRDDENMAKMRKQGIEAAERDGYVYKTPDGKYTYDVGEPNARNEVIRKPRVATVWVVKNPVKNIGYWSSVMEGKAQGVSPYVEIPNPIKGAKPGFSLDELKKNIPFFIPVNRVSTQPQAENEEKWREGFVADKLWVPEDKAREIFQALNQYKAKIDEEKERAYYESLTEVEKKEYRERKALERDTATTEAAKAKVAKDIADEEAKENPDTERLAKMKAAQERVRVKGVENFYKGQTQAKQVSERIYGDQMAKDAEEREAANLKEQADATATFKAMSPAERSAQIDAYRKDLQEQGFSEDTIEDMISQIGDQPVVKMERVGGAGSDDEDEEEEQQIIEVVLSKMERYFVDAPPTNEKGEPVGLPLGTYKKAISDLLGIGRRRVYDPETGEEIGKLEDPIWKKVAMKVMKMEKGWRDENLKKLGFRMDEDTDGDSVASASSRGGGAKPDDGELVGEGAIEFTLEKAGKALFNPTGNMTMAGKQTFTPDYDAYGATIEQGRKNAFNLSRSMYNQQQAIDVDGFQLIEDDTSLRFYLKDDEDVILVGIRGTDVKSWTDLYTWAVIGAKQDFRMTTRFQDDLQKLLRFQKQYSLQEFYYVGVGSSLAGSIADRFLDMGLLNEAITYNPSIEKKYILDGDIHNHRVYLDTDPLFILMGQYAPNTEIRKNAGRANFYNPSKEKDYLIASHSIFPVYNPAFEGGGMEGGGKTYTLEEWKAIFDAKLEQKRQQIEAREAKKKQTAKAKRERAKVRREERDEPPPLETPATFRTSRVMKATPPKEPEPAPPAPKPKAPRKPRLKVVAPAKDEPPPLEAPFRTSRVMKATPPIVKRTARQRERDEEIERLKEVIKSAQAEQRRIDEFLKGFEGLTPAGQRAIKSSQEDRSEEWSRERKARGQLNALQIQESEEIDAQIAAEKVAKFMRENDGRKPLVREEIRTRADEERLGVTKYKFGTKFYYVEDPRNDGDMNLGFYKSRQVLEAYDQRGRVTIVYIGRLGEEKQPFQGLMKQIIKAEFPSEKVYRETMGLEAPPKKPKAPARARVELRQELVAEQPREQTGEFAEPLQLVVTEIAKQPQGAFMKLMKSPKLTEADRRLFMRLKETKMTPKMRAILLGRSGLARRVMEIMGLDESAFQTKKARLKIADTTEMRVKSEVAREIDAQGWIDIKKEWKKQATWEINSGLKRTGNSETAVKSAKDMLKDIADWCVGSVECLRDAMITDWQGAWTINQEGREVDADGDKFYSRGKVGTDVWKNKTPLLTIKDTTKTASDTGQEYDEVRTYNLVIGEKGQAILLDGGGGGYEKWTIPMRTLYGFFPLMGLPIPTCKKQGRAGMMKLEIDWKEMPLVRSYKSLTAKAKEEIQEKLRSEYAPKLTAFIGIARSKLDEIVEEAIKGRVKYTDDRGPRGSKWFYGRVWEPEK